MNELLFLDLTYFQIHPFTSVHLLRLKAPKKGHFQDPIFESSVQKMKINGIKEIYG